MPLNSGSDSKVLGSARLKQAQSMLAEASDDSSLVTDVAGSVSIHQPKDAPLVAFLQRVPIDNDSIARFIMEVQPQNDVCLLGLMCAQGFDMETLVQYATKEDIALLVPRIGRRAKYTLQACMIP